MPFRPDPLRAGRLALLATAALLAAAGPASAHRLKVFASAIGSSIEGEAYFVGSGPAAGIDVTLRDKADKLLQSGKTGPDGKFALPASGSGDITVTVDAEDGHVARFTVAESELDPAPPSSPVAAPAAMPASDSSAPVVAAVAPSVPMADLEIAVARKVAPLAAQIDALQSALRIQDIVGGIGYIVGIFGLVAFLKSRRPAKDRRS
ncbi:cobalamin biosynthesis protein CbiL [Kaistia sp. MMO-174]|uniref:cobalamin biosynthesis protein CbiL n=1 Tax=Kaistia sp. MMO-174 TaxID=3081256 RepID=UPI00301724AF